jgi:putative transposase
MQIKYLHKNIYKLNRYFSRVISTKKSNNCCAERVSQWQVLRKEGISDTVCQQILGISRSSYYRYKSRIEQNQPAMASRRPKRLRKPEWTENDFQQVLMIRRQNPTYGKAKIHRILVRDFGFRWSQSTVGRILKVIKEKHLITLSLSAPRKRRKRIFKKHARPWKYDMKATKPGQMVQIDHMSISKNQIYAKHFNAWDPRSKFIHGKLYHRATSRCAKQFLLELIQKAPFKITSIQVDGGSEFMDEFEKTCQELCIDLYVLPPKRPQYNGGVERSNRTFREEFYAKFSLANSLADLNGELKKALHKYNYYRPHHNLKLYTPMEYLNNNYLGALQSHMI